MLHGSLCTNVLDLNIYITQIFCTDFAEHNFESCYVLYLKPTNLAVMAH